MSSSIHPEVTIQTSSQSIPSVPSWFGEVAVVAHTLRRLNVLATIEERVRFARRPVRYGGKGRYEPCSDNTGTTTGRLWWNNVAYWDNVPQKVWAFTIGGYPVIKKWLDYRHIDKLKRPLRSDEVRYVTEMVQRIATLLELGSSLDANYITIKGNTLALKRVATIGSFTE